MQGFHFVKKCVQTLKAAFPELAIPLQPFVGFRQRLGYEASWAPLRFAATRYKAGSLEHLEMPGNCGLAHRKGLGEFHH